MGTFACYGNPLRGMVVSNDDQFDMGKNGSRQRRLSKCSNSYGMTYGS